VGHKIEEVVKIVVNCKIEEEVIGHFGGVLAFFVQVFVDFFKRALRFADFLAKSLSADFYCRF
jgi:hypothetical protein